MKILMVSSEAVPFAKTGGLADAVSALSKSLAAKKHDARILIPRYYHIDRNTLSLFKAQLAVDMGGYEIYADIYTADLGKEAKVPVYFIDYEPLYGRDGIYGAGAEGDYRDNPLRFSLLARAAFALSRSLNWLPDIMHSHDWSGALVPVLLKNGMGGQEFKKTASVFTIHNMGYQGSYPLEDAGMLGMGYGDICAAGLEYFGRLNFLKGAVSSADIITTVSPTYAREIQTQADGFGLDGLMRERAASLAGIVNGADTHDWNPRSDKHLPASYDESDMSGKKICRRALQKHFGLPEDDARAIIAMVTRLVQQKGIAEVFAPTYGCLYRICTELPVQFVVLGSGEAWCENEIRELERKLPNFKSYIGYNEKLSHLIEAGADLFLMPSHYEPCGLNQIYSELYGTLPIVRRTGGLADTVEDYNGKSGGTGFVFDYISPDAVFDAVKRAVGVFTGNKSAFAKMQSAAMRKTFSWEESADKYIETYKRALEK
ncbi:MAG: glycogen synthase GlgA [Treponema sp.]